MLRRRLLRQPRPTPHRRPTLHPRRCYSDNLRCNPRHLRRFPPQFIQPPHDSYNLRRFPLRRNDRPHIYHHIPALASNPHGKTDANPLYSCGKPKPNSHIPTHVGAPRANHDADSFESCSGPNIGCHSFFDFINASAARTSSSAHPFGTYRLPRTDHHIPPNTRDAATR